MEEVTSLGYFTRRANVAAAELEVAVLTKR